MGLRALRERSAHDGYHDGLEAGAAQVRGEEIEDDLEEDAHAVHEDVLAGEIEGDFKGASSQIYSP